MSKGFSIGGIHPPANKLSSKEAIIAFPLCDVVTIPLSQHIGAPATACVAKGDRVRVGQLIGKATGFVSANIHASVSGTVVSVDAVADGGGVRRPAVTIQVEGDEWESEIDRTPQVIKSCSLTQEEIIAKIAQCGIVGMGGATFPTQIKLMVPPGKTAECLIINGVECEPYLTADDRVMLERGEELLVGIEILSRALGVERIYIGIEENKPNAIEKMTLLIKAYPSMEVVPLRVQYPQGGEKQLIAAVLGREVPSGGLPIDVGAVVQNVGTALAVYEAVQKNKPLVERVVTVTGKAMAHKANFLVRIGTPLQALIDYCGGIPADTGKVINGGPMMGRAVTNLDAPVTKGTSGVLLMRERESVRPQASACIKCARCVSVCPMALEPYLISRMAKLGRYAELESEKITDCIECGSCSYACPASIPLLDYIRLGKGEVMKLIRARK